MGLMASEKDVFITEEIQRLPKEKKQIVPKGAFRYFFSESGKIVDEKDSVFSCIARKEKTAFKKFERWKENNLQ